MMGQEMAHRHEKGKKKRRMEKIMGNSGTHASIRLLKPRHGL